MTAYWDDLRTRVRETDESSPNDTFFVQAVVAIESEVIKAVSLVTGDREFPPVLREKIQNVIALHAIDYNDFVHGPTGPRTLPVNEESRAWLIALRYSQLFEELHSAFHVVAGGRHKHRFEGFFSDSPEGFLKRRAEFEAEGRT